jgi:hypothetical protein
VAARGGVAVWRLVAERRVRTVMIKPNNNKLAIGERTYALRLEPSMPAR